jgi:hypothetical protein
MKIKLGKFEIEINISLSWEKNYLKQVKQALREGRRLQALKIYKDATGLGLKDSKEAVDLLLPKYYKDYKPVEKWFPNPNAVSTVQHQGCIPTDVKTFYFSSHPAPAVKDATLKQFSLVPIPNPGTESKQMFGACKASTDLFSNIMNPQPLFVGTLEQCQEWAKKQGIVCTMIGLSEDEVNKYVRNKLSQSSNAGSDTPNPNAEPETNDDNQWLVVKEPKRYNLIYFKKGTWRECQNWRFAQPDRNDYYVVHGDRNHHQHPSVWCNAGSDTPNPGTNLNPDPGTGVTFAVINSKDNPINPVILFMGTWANCWNWKNSRPGNLKYDYTVITPTPAEIKEYYNGCATE